MVGGIAGPKNNPTHISKKQSPQKDILARLKRTLFHLSYI